MADAFMNMEISKRYSLSRPVLPKSIVDEISKTYFEGTYKQTIDRVIDVGCGSGQFSLLMASVAGQVTAVDISSTQINEARQCRNANNIRYHIGPYDAIPVVNESTDVMTCSQAAHFFDEAKFYGEVDRCLRPGGLLALTGYGQYELVDAPENIKKMDKDFWNVELKPYWFPKKKIVDNLYRDIKLPYNNEKRFYTHMEKSCDTETWSTYLRSLSAYYLYKEAQPHSEDPVDRLVAATQTALGKETIMKLRWPVFLVTCRKPFLR